MTYDAYLTTAERTSSRHRSPIILHLGSWYFAEFQTADQLDFFAETLGFSHTLTGERETPENGILRMYKLDREIIDHLSFWTRSEVPADAKPIKALSNGSIVTCYFTNDGKTIRFYRPNPNAKEVYHPLPIEQDIAHRRIYGLV